MSENDCLICDEPIFIKKICKKCLRTKLIERKVDIPDDKLYNYFVCIKHQI